MKDRRVRKTQQAIHTAFAKLLSDKDFKDITVKELCEMADINKSTFYLHYKDLYDCSESFMNDVVDKTIKFMEQYDFTELVNHLPEITKEVANVFTENKDLYMLLLNSPRYSFVIYRLKRLTIEKLLEKTNKNKINNILAKSVASFVICGIFGVLEQNEFNELTPEVISVLTDKIQNGFIYSKDTY